VAPERFLFRKRFLRVGGIAILLGLLSIPTALFPAENQGPGMDLHETARRLRRHLAELTRTIGERSVYTPENLKNAETYIRSAFVDGGLSPRSQTYRYQQIEVANVTAEVSLGGRPLKRYVIGAHYDSVAGSVGADDNASAVAVLLETARRATLLKSSFPRDVWVKFVAFALEEPPVYSTRHMGSRVYVRNAKEVGEEIDGMICLEMVGFTCRQPGCQEYPFPLTYFGYPKMGDFIGIVGNFKSRPFTRQVTHAFLNSRQLPVVKLTVPLSGWILPSVRLSDHASFWDAGYKAVMITDSAFYRNPHYHLSSDTMDTLDFDFMARLVQSLVHFLFW